MHIHTHVHFNAVKFWMYMYYTYALYIWVLGYGGMMDRPAEGSGVRAVDRRIALALCIVPFFIHTKRKKYIDG